MAAVSSARLTALVPAGCRTISVGSTSSSVCFVALWPPPFAPHKESSNTNEKYRCYERQKNCETPAANNLFEYARVRCSNRLAGTRSECSLAVCVTGRPTTPEIGAAVWLGVEPFASKYRNAHVTKVFQDISPAQGLTDLSREAQLVAAVTAAGNSPIRSSARSART